MQAGEQVSMKAVIIGAGPAGATVAEVLRQNDSSTEIILISAEPFPPYSPPAMLEYFTTGKEVHFWKGKDFAEKMSIDYRPGTKVQAVLPDEHTISLVNGDKVSYDRLVLASGARLYAPLQGEDKAGIYNFKSLSAAEELLRKIRDRHARRALIVGAGFIGVEIGLLLADLGLEVTQLVRSRVMRSMLDTETSQVLLEIMQQRGISVLQGAEADAVAFTGETHAEGVQTRSGEILRADIIVAATGLKPNIDYLEGSNIETNFGVLVDEHLHTNYPDISAAGDVAETKNRITGERFVHANFPNAVTQGRIVAYNLLGWDIAYEGADVMNSPKHLGLFMVAVGQMEGEELRMKRRDILRKIYLQDNRIIGFRLVGDISGAGIYRTLMNRKINVASFKQRLLEPGFGMGYIEELAISPANWATS
jgi:NAD(P)H-nitrite reductase large subunit